MLQTGAVLPRLIYKKTDSTLPRGPMYSRSRAPPAAHQSASFCKRASRTEKRGKGETLTQMRTQRHNQYHGEWVSGRRLEFSKYGNSFFKMTMVELVKYEIRRFYGPAVFCFGVDSKNS